MRTGIGRIKETLCHDGIEEVESHDACLRSRRQIFLVDFYDAIQSGQTKDYATLCSDAATGKTGPRTSWHNWQALFASKIDDFDHVFCVSRKYDDIGQILNLRCGIIAEGNQIFFLVKDILCTEDIGQFLDGIC